MNDKLKNDKLEGGKRFDIYDRALEFAVRVGRLVNQLPKSVACLEYQKQLVRSSGSIGANIGEADGALSKKDFINKMGIARREARESRHWLDLMIKTDSVGSGPLREELFRLLQEGNELTLILSSIIKSTQDKMQRESIRANG